MLAYDRLIALDGAHNVRDLGGYRTRDGGLTRWHSIFRGDALHALSEADMAVLRDHDLSTVIDLRNAAEIASEANPFDGHAQVHYINTSVFSALAPVEMMAADYAAFDMGDRYCQALDKCQASIAEVLGTIAAAPEGAVLFHCSAGKDRTGIIAALLLANAGVNETTIIEDYALTGTISGPLIANLRTRALARGIPGELADIVLASAPHSMARALAHLDDAHGGVHRYMTRIGLSVDEIESLKRRLLA
ncbi:protein-tyrosine phosphatase [Rhizobium sp. NFR07]|uniref:tyrosine-protein phosphatase n=1 Tax=Rhizobium sp. NFR07 TaxID=1566262 RepID=UPI0008EE7850|nr:tyrosine-protein phosphatase [Rhizobium sp. NFR07]SFB43446.1 protein-tyrosine phosphatase [Rhizobium sp. NFR07]